jgi:hypothetical protein
LIGSSEKGKGDFGLEIEGMSKRKRREARVSNRKDLGPRGCTAR